jgi:hypothetical protein
MRMKSRLTGIALATLGVAATLGAPGVASAATVVNAGFETGDLTGWTTVETGSGSWDVYSGTTTAGGLTVGAPPEGTYAVATHQFGPGSHILYQDVALAAGASHTLKLSLYWYNLSGFVTPVTPTLDWASGSIQQLRVDVTDPAAAADSVAPADLLMPVFQSQPTDANTHTAADVTADLSAFAGRTVRIRIAESDNQGLFGAAVDDLRIESSGGAGPATPGPATPDPATPAPPAATPTPPTPAPSVCTSRRAFTIHVRPAQRRLRSARVTLDGKRVAVRSSKDGRLIARVDLRGLPEGTYRVRISAKDSLGRQIRETRTYRTC